MATERYSECSIAFHTTISNTRKDSYAMKMNSWITGLVLIVTLFFTSITMAASCWKVTGWSSFGDHGEEQALLEMADCTITPDHYGWARIIHFDSTEEPTDDIFIMISLDNDKVANWKFTPTLFFSKYESTGKPFIYAVLLDCFTQCIIDPLTKRCEACPFKTWLKLSPPSSWIYNTCIVPIGYNGASNCYQHNSQKWCESKGGTYYPEKACKWMPASSDCKDARADARMWMTYIRNCKNPPPTGPWICGDMSHNEASQCKKFCQDVRKEICRHGTYPNPVLPSSIYEECDFCIEFL